MIDADKINDRIHDILFDRYYDRALEAFIDEFADEHGVNVAEARAYVMSQCFDTDAFNEALEGNEFAPYQEKADGLLKAKYPELEADWCVEQHEDDGIADEWFLLLHILYAVDFTAHVYESSNKYKTVGKQEAIVDVCEIKATVEVEVKLKAKSELDIVKAYHNIKAEMNKTDFVEARITCITTD